MVHMYAYTHVSVRVEMHVRSERGTQDRKRGEEESGWMKGTSAT